MNARANVGKLQRVFAPGYLTLRDRWPKAFAIRPTRGGYEAVVFIEEGASNGALDSLERRKNAMRRVYE